MGALFLLGAILILRGRHGKDEDDEHLSLAEGRAPTFARVAGTSFLVILVAEFGDLTQIVTANLAAKYHDPLSVGLGALLGLWAVAALVGRRWWAALVGRRSLRLLNRLD